MQKKALDALQHALGRDKYGRPNPSNPDYRNRYVAGPGHDSWDVLLKSVSVGLMVCRKGNELTGGGDVFAVTDAGKAYIAEHSPKPPTLSRAQKRYRDWVKADGNLSFAEFNGWRSRSDRQRG